jgi:signal transduction histidine kinase
VKRRIVTTTVAITALAMALLGVPLAIAASRLYRSQEVARLQGEAIGTGSAVAAAALESGGPVSLRSTSGGFQLGVYNAAGQLVAGEGPAQGGTDVRTALGGRVSDVRSGRWLVAAVPVHDEDLVVGAVRAATPWDLVADRTHTAWLVMLGLGAVALAVAGGLTWRQASRLAAPIDDLAKGAVRIGEGDFGVRLAPTGIPELDKAAAALNRTAGRLADLMSRERAFSSDASHQLATPLTSLRLGMESALLDDGSDTRGALVDAVEEVERLQRTVATLLALARDSPMANASCDVSAAAAEAASRYRDALSQAGRPLRVDLETALPAVRCSHDVLREILDVLLDNSVRHGGGDVALLARRAGNGVIVEVEDQGAGVADPAALFRRRAPGASGHGIGLALARSLAEAHGGRLEVTRSRPGPVFAIAFPGGAIEAG